MTRPVLAFASSALVLLLVACGGAGSNKSSGSGGGNGGGGSGTGSGSGTGTGAQWAWISGSQASTTSSSQPGVYGTLGTAAAGNVPGSRGVANGWADSSGNIWIFGGFQSGSTANPLAELNDLWMFDPTSNEWTWISGSNTTGAAGVYGTQGTAAAANVPGARSDSVSWTDANGNFWLFGGLSPNNSPTFVGDMNDLWMFNPASTSRQWTWEGGSQTTGASGVYGTLGTPAAGNFPGAREQAISWSDTSGNLWLFGGYGFDGSTQTTIDLNDLWEYSTKTNQWTWVSGSNVGGAKGTYGTLGAASSTNVPGSREFGSSWIDASGNLWLFGGYGYDANKIRGRLEDMWEFSPSNQQWTWVAGNKQANTSGTYGTQGTPAASNTPGARNGGVTWVDTSGNLWLFGGNGYDSSGTLGELNDLWKFSPTTKQWTWVSGSNKVNGTGVYGTEGTAAAANFPGSRDSGISITDKSGNFWLFGGYTGSSKGADSIALNDLWRYQP